MEGENDKSKTRDRESISEGSDLSFSTPQDKTKAKPSKKKTKTTEAAEMINTGKTKVHAQLVELNKKKLMRHLKKLINLRKIWKPSKRKQ